MSALPSMSIAIPNESDKNLEDFMRVIAKKMFFGVPNIMDQLFNVCNDYWGTSFRELYFQDIVLSKSNSRSASVASTPRAGQSASNDTLTNSQFMSKLSAAQDKKRKVGGGNSTCVAIISRGDKKGQACGVKCTGDFCAKHSKPPLPPSATAMDTTEPSSGETVANKRKMLKKDPVPLTNIDKFIEQQVATFKVVRKPSGVLVHPTSRLVYDEEKDEIYGKLSEDDKTILPLSLDDIEQCKSYKINYQLPLKLGEIQDVVPTVVQDDYEELSGDDE